jgi:hypothetical protein
MPMLVDRPVRLEAEQGKKRTGLGEQDLAVDPDAAFVRERRPLRPLERLEVQFQTRTSRYSVSRCTGIFPTERIRCTSSSAVVR